jgi:hypothetical protein
MKRATLGCLMAVFLGLSSARPAQANIGGLLDYIGGLSGPGPFDLPFKRPGFTLDVVCLEGKRGDKSVEEALENKKPVPLTWLRFCPGDLRAPRQSYGFLVGGWLHTDRIPDTYVYSPEKESLKKALMGTGTITAIPVALTFKTTIPFVTNQKWLRSVDVGATAGIVIFKSGEKDGQTLFSAFAVPSAELGRVTARPLAFIACVRNGGKCPAGWSGWDGFEVMVTTRLIGKVTSEQFGAAQGIGSEFYIREDYGFGFSYKF